MLKSFHFPVDNLECPFGHECSRCLLYVPVKGENPHTGEPIDDYDCAIVVNAVMVGDTGRSIRSLHKAVNQSQNQADKRQDEFFDVVANGVLSHVDTRLAQLSGRPALSPSLPEQEEPQRLSYPGQGSYGQSPDDDGGDPPQSGQ